MVNFLSYFVKKSWANLCGMPDRCLIPYFIEYNAHTSIVRTWISQWFLAKKLFLFFKNNFTKINHCKFIHHKSHLTYTLSQLLPCLMGMEYFSVIFNVKRCILYSIKYGNNYYGSGKYFSIRLFAQSSHFSVKTFSLNVMCLTSCIYFYPILPLHEISDRHLTVNIMTGGKYLTNRLSSLPSLPSLPIFFVFSDNVLFLTISLYLLHLSLLSVQSHLKIFVKYL
jgi:hypothetical protein